MAAKAKKMTNVLLMSNENNGEENNTIMKYMKYNVK